MPTIEYARTPIKNLINGLAIQAHIEVPSDRPALAMISDPQRFGGAVIGDIEVTKDEFDAMMESECDKYSDHSIKVYKPLGSSDTLVEFHVYLSYHYPNEDKTYVRYFLLKPTHRATYRFSELDIEDYEKRYIGSIQRS